MDLHTCIYIHGFTRNTRPHAVNYSSLLKSRVVIMSQTPKIEDISLEISPWDYLPTLLKRYKFRLT